MVSTTASCKIAQLMLPSDAVNICDKLLFGVAVWIAAHVIVLHSCNLCAASEWISMNRY